MILDKDFEDFLSLLNQHEHGVMTQIGYPPLRIDILNEIDGVTFTEAYPNKRTIEVDGLQVSYIGLDDLIKKQTSYGAST